MSNASLDEGRFERRVSAHLSGAARALEPRLVARLASARERAVMAHKLAPRSKVGLRARSTDAMTWLVRSQAWRPALLALLVLASFVAGEWRMSSQQLDERMRIDTALLSDDLPIDAYLDPGFRAWLLQDQGS